MKLLFEFLPMLLFFVTFKFADVYAATAVAIIASVLQTTIHWAYFRRFESMHIIMLVCILLFGGITLLLHNEMYIKWKPTAVNWLLAFLFLASQFVGRKNYTQRIWETKINLPKAVWQRLNLGYVLFFIFLGSANLYVIYHYSTKTWVNFKVFGILGLTLIFAIVQTVYMSKYLEKEKS